jgi:dUTP pyrophosphatase
MLRKGLLLKIIKETYMEKIVKCQVLKEGLLPTKAHASDAGYDLFATSDFEILPGEIVKHPVNIKLELPDSTYAEITSKSGNGLKGLLVYAGIIDEGYRGVVHVIMTNLKTVIPNSKLSIKKGQKIAQMIIHPYSKYYSLVQVDEISSETDRGAGGFGSSGNSLV